MEKVFFFARSPCFGYTLICFRGKAYSYRRLFFFIRSSGIRRGSFYQEFRCVQEINSQHTLLTILNYSTEHLNLPDHYKWLPVSLWRIKRNTIIFPGTWQIPQIHLRVLWVCTLDWNPEHPIIPGKETYLTVHLILPVRLLSQWNWPFSNSWGCTVQNISNFPVKTHLRKLF